MEELNKLLLMIQERKQKIALDIASLEGFRRYEDHLLQGIQTNRFVIREVEENIFRNQSEMIQLIEEASQEIRLFANANS